MFHWLLLDKYGIQIRVEGKTGRGDNSGRGDNKVRGDNS